MAEATFQAQARSEVPPEQAWAVVCETARYAEWVAGTEAVARTAGPARLGSSYAEVNPMLGPWKARTTWTVVEFGAPRRQVHRTVDIPLVRELLVTMQAADAPGGCELAITLSARPRTDRSVQRCSSCSPAARAATTSRPSRTSPPASPPWHRPRSSEQVMAREGQTIQNARTGQRMTIVMLRDDVLRVETVNPLSTAK